MIRNILIVAVYLLNYGYDESDAIPLTMNGGNTTTSITFNNFLVSIHIEDLKYPGTPILLCGGCIISQTFVITAAHCVYEFTPANIHVRVGSTYQFLEGQYRNVLELHGVTGYDPQTKEDDIGLLRLTESLTFNVTVGEINFFPISSVEFEYTVGVTVKAIGFGRRSDRSSAIHVAHMTIVNNAECKGFTADFDHRFCIQNKSIQISKNDEGSPVIYGDTLIGIVSLTQGIKDRSVIVKVFDYYDKIRRVMNEFP